MWWTGQRDFSEESGLRAGGAMRKLRFGGLVEHFHFGSEKPLKILNKSSHPERGGWEGRAVPGARAVPLDHWSWHVPSSLTYCMTR